MVDKLVGTFPLTEEHLSNCLDAIGEHFEADCLTYLGPITYGTDDFIRERIEALKRKKKRLLFILETNGGYAEVTQRIANTLRHHYRAVEFLIPSHALSAGTILVMSGDAIHMDYYSVLGPIDPQVPNREGNLIPALGYLIRYGELLDKANAGKISTAEMSVLLNFNQGDLFSYEQARDLSRALLKEWLVKYKFKNWKRTGTRKKPVTLAMKRARAEEIAKKLDDVRKWNSHGIGIGMKLLTRDLKLKIDDFGADRELSAAVRAYHTLLMDYTAKRRHRVALHTSGIYQGIAVG